VSRLSATQMATLVVASIFAARAVLRFAQLEFNILRFAVLGLPSWAVWGVSVAELAGAVLLVRRASFPAGVMVLAAVAVLFLLAYVRVGVPAAGMDSAGLLIALGGLVLLHRRREA
jgi:hypothetical protein